MYSPELDVRRTPVLLKNCCTSPASSLPHAVSLNRSCFRRVIHSSHRRARSLQDSTSRAIDSAYPLARAASALALSTARRCVCLSVVLRSCGPPVGLLILAACGGVVVEDGRVTTGGPLRGVEAGWRWKPRLMIRVTTCPCPPHLTCAGAERPRRRLAS